jgi:cobalamin biosynthesis protein CobT
MLELAIWKSKIVEQTDGVIYLLDADLKMVCCIDSLTMVGIFVPNILSFLRGNANEGNDDDEDDGDDDEDYGDDDNDDDNNDADDDGDDDDSDEDNGDGEDEY